MAFQEARFAAKLARNARQARRLAFRVLVESGRTSVTGHARTVVVVVVARLVLTLSAILTIFCPYDVAELPRATHRTFGAARRARGLAGLTI